MKIITMSHGELAKAITQSASMIVGEHSVQSVCMSFDDGLEGTSAKLDAIFTDEPTIILADLFGGTPCNVAMMKAATHDNVRVVSGLNLGMLIEAILSPEEDLDVLANALEESGRLSVQHAIPVISDGEEFDE